jgi:hypothetical protein
MLSFGLGEVAVILGALLLIVGAFLLARVLLSWQPGGSARKLFGAHEDATHRTTESPPPGGGSTE